MSITPKQRTQSPSAIDPSVIADGLGAMEFKMLAQTRELYLTPGSSLHSTADDPRKGGS